MRKPRQVHAAGELERHARRQEQRPVRVQGDVGVREHHVVQASVGGVLEVRLRGPHVLAPPRVQDKAFRRSAKSLVLPLEMQEQVCLHELR